MEFFEVVEKRRTIRDFEIEAMPMDIIEKIIEAGLKAPTNDHMRDWHYVVIQDKSVVMKLLDIIPKGISEEGYACTLRVPLGNEGEWARDVLGYPEDYFMPCFIGMGKPKMDADVIKQKDIEVKERIHWDRW